MEINKVDIKQLTYEQVETITRYANRHKYVKPIYSAIEKIKWEIPIYNRHDGYVQWDSPYHFQFRYRPQTQTIEIYTERQNNFITRFDFKHDGIFKGIKDIPYRNLQTILASLEIKEELSNDAR